MSKRKCTGPTARRWAGPAARKRRPARVALRASARQGALAEGAGEHKIDNSAGILAMDGFDLPNRLS